jgi:hypothetical protein
MMGDSKRMTVDSQQHTDQTSNDELIGGGRSDERNIIAWLFKKDSTDLAGSLN